MILRPLHCALALLALVAGGCSSNSQVANLDFVYVGAANTALRKDLAARSESLVMLKVGDRLEVLEARRRLLHVRTADGATGWVDGNLLLTGDEMAGLEHLREQASKLPSQGKATVGDPLNVHTAPNRLSPVLVQVGEEAQLDVIGHRVAPRTGTISEVARLAMAKPPKATLRTRPKKPPLLPPPAAPAPPRNWLELSRPRIKDLPESDQKALLQPALPIEDWNLVRTSSGEVGWVLGRMLYFELPDNIARFAQGENITAYLPLGSSGSAHPTLVWTTRQRIPGPLDFDTVRVSVWNEAKHHYNPPLMERGIAGFYPLESAVLDQGGEGFSVVARESSKLGPRAPNVPSLPNREDSKLIRRTYVVERVAKSSRLRLVDRGDVMTAKSAMQDGYDAITEYPRDSTGWKAKWEHWTGQAKKQ